MYYCTIYGIKVKSNFCITEGIQIEPTEDVEAFVEMGEVPAFIKEELKNNHVAEFRDKYCWIFIPDLGYYYIENGNHIVIEKDGNDTEYTIMTFLTGLAFALLFTQKGYVPLHGSVLDYKGKGCLISGPSGSGKSSTAFELLKRGATFVADDIGMVDTANMTVNPGFPVQRLCEDQIERLGFDKSKLEYLGERKNKYARRLEPDEYIYEKRPFDAMFRIRRYDGDELICEEITGADKIKIVAENVFCYFFISDMKMKPQDMMRYMQIATKVRIFSIKRPKDKNTLDEIVDFIFDRMQTL